MPFKREIESDDDEEENFVEEESEDLPAIGDNNRDFDEGETENVANDEAEGEQGSNHGRTKKVSSDNDDDEEEDVDEESEHRSEATDRSSFISSSVVPSSLRGLRACLLCALVKTIDQFETGGCNNCDRFLHLRGNRSSVLECTSSSFDGLVMLMSPTESWVAKWQRWERCVAGAYAVSVTGQLPQDIIEELGNHGYPHISRDTSLRV